MLFRDEYRLPLLDAVVKESMRILPTVPYTVRAVAERTELGGVPAFPGDRVVCSHYVTHHMPEIYPQPDRFDPLRWFTIRPSSYEYFPFSAGQRVCLGRYMAMMLMKLLADYRPPTVLVADAHAAMARLAGKNADGKRVNEKVRAKLGP